MHRLGSEILFKNLPLNRGRLLLGVRSSSFKNEGNSIFNPFNRFLNQKFEINESGCVGVIHANKILEYCDDPNDVEQALKDIRNFYPFSCRGIHEIKVIKEIGEITFLQIEDRVKFFHMIVAMNSDKKISYLHYSGKPFQIETKNDISDLEKSGFKIIFPFNQYDEVFCGFNFDGQKSVTGVRQPGDETWKIYGLYEK